MGVPIPTLYKESQKCCGIILTFRIAMSGQCKLGKGRNGSRRRKMMSRDIIHGISRTAIRRLARCGGVIRIFGIVYEETIIGTPLSPEIKSTRKTKTAKKPIEIEDMNRYRPPIPVRNPFTSGWGAGPWTRIPDYWTDTMYFRCNSNGMLITITPP